ncbi:MAG: 2-oxo acid dehydrogenase subunit E2 [Gammaproteobacteria bacterium]|nr:2-oxo acid dehydrogenase subunit E2 [Gammaproteobacteria bacterium]
MSRELRLPSLGADMDAGTLVEWRVRPGSRVRKGEVMALVETDKGIIDLECFEDSTVERLLVEPGTRVAVGTALALLAGEAAPATQVGSGAEVTAPAVRASPAARVRARVLGVALEGLAGTGLGGAVTLEDVERVARTAAAVPVAGKAAGLRAAIAAAMSRSKREIPHYYVQLTIDFGPAAAWLGAYNAHRPPLERLLPAVLLLKATATAAREFPAFNGFYTAQGFESAAVVNLGVAIALRGGGVVAPALLDADRKPLAQLMPELQGLVERARRGHLRSGEAASATLTVTSLGEEGADAVLPVIHPPQVAMIGFGSVLERPWVVDGRIEVRPVLGASLAADHRVTDGRQGAQFLARIRDGLSKPEAL